MNRPGALVVTLGTGTEVGKTWISARLLELWRGRGVSVAARKPAQSFDPDDHQPTDAAVLGAATGEQPEMVCPPRRTYPLAMAPPMAAAALDRPGFTIDDLGAEIDFPDGTDVAVVEGAGGLRSPLADDGDNVDLAAALAPTMVVLVADAGLGTINAVRLGAAVLQDRLLPFVVVLNRFDEREPVHRSNLQWLCERDGLDVVPATHDELVRLANRIVSR